MKYGFAVTFVKIFEKLEEPVFIAENDVRLQTFIRLCDDASFFVAALKPFVVDESFRAAGIQI